MNLTTIFKSLIFFYIGCSHSNASNKDSVELNEIDLTSKYAEKRVRIKKAIVVDIRGASKATRLQVVSIQGIVNRSRPLIYVLDESSNEERWQRLIEKNFGVEFTPKTADEIIKEYSSVIGKQVLYDLNEPHTINVATTIAGIESAILTNVDLGVPTVFDVRGKWKGLIESYRWSISNLLPKTTKDGIGYASEESVGMKDYAISKKMFNFQLDSTNRADHIEMFKEILSYYPVMTPLLGYPSPEFLKKDADQDFVTAEVSATSLISSKGKVMIPTDGVRNLSFLTWLAPKGDIRQSLPGSIHFDKNKRYVSLIASDGDNIQYVLNRMREHWEAKAKTSVPLGWTITPTLSLYAPAVLDVYYRESSERKLDEFIGGPSGFGYSFPSLFNDKESLSFAKKTREANLFSDLRSTFILDIRDASSSRLRQYVGAFEKHGERAMWFRKVKGLGDGDGLQGKLSFMSSSHVIFGDNIESTVNDIKHSVKSKQFSMIYLDAWGFDFSKLDEIKSKVGSNVVFVLPSQLMNLFRASRGVDQLKDPQGRPKISPPLVLD